MPYLVLDGEDDKLRELSHRKVRVEVSKGAEEELGEGKVVALDLHLLLLGSLGYPRVLELAAVEAETQATKLCESTRTENMNKA